jgi:hypothetical protein
MDGAPPCPNNTVVSGGTHIVSAAVEGDHVTSSKKNESNAAARHSNDIIAVSKALSGTNGHRSSSGRNSGNSTMGGVANGNYEVKSGSFHYMTGTSPTTEATNMTSGFCHSRSTGVLGAMAAIKWNGVGTGSEGGIVRQESPPTGQRALEPGIGVNRSSPFLHHDEPVLRFSVPFRNNPMLRNA